MARSVMKIAVRIAVRRPYRIQRSFQLDTPAIEQNPTLSARRLRLSKARLILVWLDARSLAPFGVEVSDRIGSGRQTSGVSDGGLATKLTLDRKL